MEVYDKQNTHLMTGIQNQKAGLQNRESKDRRTKHQDSVGGKVYRAKGTATAKALGEPTNHTENKTSSIPDDKTASALGRVMAEFKLEWEPRLVAL